MSDNVVEYKNRNPVECGYITIPREIICDTSLGAKRASIFSLCSIKRGIDDEFVYSNKKFSAWFGRTENSSMNKQFEKMIHNLSNMGYINKIDNYNIKDEVYLLNTKKIKEENQHGFAILYVDEFQKIKECANEKIQGGFSRFDMTLLVFAYLRMVIPRRNNKLRIEEINFNNKNSYEEDINHRRLAYPEAYSAYYNDISAAIGLTVDQVSFAVQVLCDLHLIACEELPRVKVAENWYRSKKIFANTYKRELGFELESGEKYYQREIANKRKKMGIYYSTDQDE